jgi:hypothetical protein
LLTLPRNFKYFFASFIQRPIGQVQESQKSKFAMIALYPDLGDDSDIFTEIIFLVDRSGSMAGQRMTQVKETLQILLRR